MAGSLPEGRISTQAWPSAFLTPDDRYALPLVDWEYGPVAVSDPSQGLLVQIWKLEYDPDEFKFWLTPDDGNGTPIEIVDLDGITDVNEVGLAFDQNGDLFILYERQATIFYYWWDATQPGYVTHQLEAGAKSGRCGMDDKRPLDLATSGILLTYIHNGNLMVRYQVERYDTPHVLDTGIGVGSLSRFGMTRNLRVRWDGGQSSIYLADIVRQICWWVGIIELDTSELAGIKVRGFMTAGNYSAADALRSLMRCYLFDMPEIDGQLYCKLRGGPVVATITLDDMVETKRINFEDAREQEVEFPRKLHLKFKSAESDYTPTKQTSERSSFAIAAQTEVDIEVPINYTEQDAKNVATVLHKIAWNEFEGRGKFAVSEAFAFLTGGDPILVEVEEGVFKRMRIERGFLMQDHSLEFECVIDRASSYSAEFVVPTDPINPPLPPPTNLPGATIWEYMNLPALTSQHDTLHAYVAGYGTSEAWNGAEVQLQDGTEWLDVGFIPAPSIMGVSLEALPDHPPGLDVTNSVLIQLNGEVSTITQEEFDAGGNACVINDELINFRDVVDEGGGPSEGQWNTPLGTYRYTFEDPASQFMDATLTDPEIQTYIDDANAIWAQANCEWQTDGSGIQDVVISASEFSNPSTDPQTFREQLRDICPPGPGPNVVFLKTFPVGFVGLTLQPENCMFIAEEGQNPTNGTLLAHEIGHTVNLVHVTDSTNLMHPSAGGPGYENATNLTQQQIITAQNALGEPTSAPSGQYLYRISHLNRGAINTETEAHSPDSRFVMLSQVTRLYLDTQYLNQSVTLRAVSYGTDPVDATPITVTFEGKSQIEWAPLNPAAVQQGNDWVVSWDSNPRIGYPFGAVDSVNLEGYRIRFDSGGTVESYDVPKAARSFTLSEAEQIAKWGSAVVAWDSIEIMGLNRFTGEGDIALVP